MPGPAKKPALQVVREGNPGKRAIPESVTLPPATFGDPDWSEAFPKVKLPSKPARPRRRKGEKVGTWETRIRQFERRLAAWDQLAVSAEGSEWGRARATAEWARVVPVLRKSVGLGDPDWSTVVDYCVCTARVEWCERRLSVEGLVVQGDRGMAKNPLTTIVSQYRTQLKTYIRELGLSPSARTGVPPREDDDGPDDEDPFD